MPKKLTKQEAYKLLDKRITSILKRTPSMYWHEILDSLGERIKRENRYFIPDGIDPDSFKHLLRPATKEELEKLGLGHLYKSK